MFESAQTRVLRRTRLRSIWTLAKRSGPNGAGGMRNVPAALKRLRPRTQCCRLRAGYEAGVTSADSGSNDGRSSCVLPFSLWEYGYW